MKVIKLTDEDDVTRLRSKERTAISTLRITGDQRYIKGVGMRDGDFYLLEETEEDSEYLSFAHSQNLSLDAIINGLQHASQKDVNNVEFPSDGTLVFFKTFSGNRKYLFRTLWDFTIVEKSLF
tara:strand:+ start:2186 stop:2554 length:369 start_codon:yes stop_codon:yes gene_type:complete